MKSEQYSFNEHKHRYAVWTAARAVQRNFTTTKNIEAAIDGSGLRKFAEEDNVDTLEEFEKFHRGCAKKIIKNLEDNGIKNASYGRSAKIISIYLKTSIILCNRGECLRSQFIHPPIDHVLLTNIAKDIPQLKELKTVKWTSLEEEPYWELIAKLKSHFTPFNWKLEKYWKPDREN